MIELHHKLSEIFQTTKSEIDKKKTSDAST
jgi:hypothetical protein